jgi:exopolysaccharide biosynthesis glucuronosyltransferase PssE
VETIGPVFSAGRLWRSGDLIRCDPGVGCLIFVTVGNATQGFRRLLDAVDVLAGKGTFNGEEVLIQFGSNSDFQASHCKQEAFLQTARFAEAMRTASLVISHAGAGTLIHSWQAGHTPVVMPRRKQYGELIDDHQAELVNELAAEGRVIAAYEPHELAPAIAQARNRESKTLTTPLSQMIALVTEAIHDLSCGK